MLVNDNNTNKDYESLEGYEGYIQLSGEKILTVEKDGKLKPWEDLHTNNNFIIEAHFFNNSSNDSVAIRQINSEYRVFKTTITSKELEGANIFQAKGRKSVKIAQRWEEIEDEHCNNLKVLKPTMQLFAGFAENKGETK